MSCRREPPPPAAQIRLHASVVNTAVFMSSHDIVGAAEHDAFRDRQAHRRGQRAVRPAEGAGEPGGAALSRAFLSVSERFYRSVRGCAAAMGRAGFTLHFILQPAAKNRRLCGCWWAVGPKGPPGAIVAGLPGCTVRIGRRAPAAAGLCKSERGGRSVCE